MACRPQLPNNPPRGALHHRIGLLVHFHGAFLFSPLRCTLSRISPHPPAASDLKLCCREHETIVELASHFCPSCPCAAYLAGLVEPYSPIHLFCHRHRSCRGL